MSLVERIWWGRGAGAAAARAALAPLELAYRGAVGVRGWLYARGVLPAHATDVPAISIGNLAVGGTGKTPVAAWVARELVRRGARPAIVLRGYGEDEPRVHALLNPDVPVVVAPDRVAGAREARERGCDVVVLDDAMQHRRARRAADVVLVSADRWAERPRLLPAGPWREGPSALRRATVIVVTRKAAGAERAAEVRAWAGRHAPGVESAVVELAPDELRAWGTGERFGLEALRGERVLAVAAIGDPAAFARQLEALGAVPTLRARADHHAFTPAEAVAFARDGRSYERVVCTLKDAVKLGPLWPRAETSLWYVSQRVRVEGGAAALDRVLDEVAALALAARAVTPPADRRRAPANSSSHAH